MRSQPRESELAPFLRQSAQRRRLKSFFYPFFSRRGSLKLANRGKSKNDSLNKQNKKESVKKSPLNSLTKLNLEFKRQRNEKRAKVNKKTNL